MKLKKVVSIKDKRYYNQQAEDLKYWLSRSPDERISMVENLRKEMLYNGAPPRLQRTITITQRESNRDELIKNKKASGRPRDIADLDDLGTK